MSSALFTRDNQATFPSDTDQLQGQLLLALFPLEEHCLRCCRQCFKGLGAISVPTQSFSLLQLLTTDRWLCSISIACPIPTKRTKLFQSLARRTKSRSAFFQSCITRTNGRPSITRPASLRPITEHLFPASHRPMTGQLFSSPVSRGPTAEQLFFQSSLTRTNGREAHILI